MALEAHLVEPVEVVVIGQAHEPVVQPVEGAVAEEEPFFEEALDRRARELLQRQLVALGCTRQ